MVDVRSRESSRAVLVPMRLGLHFGLVAFGDGYQYLELTQSPSAMGRTVKPRAQDSRPLTPPNTEVALLGVEMSLDTARMSAYATITFPTNAAARW
jgi:hypothetical protein